MDIDLEKNNIIKIRDYIISLDSVLVMIVILLCIINILYNHDKPLVILFINLILLLFYFCFTDKTKVEKIILLVTFLHFSFWGVIIENYIIKQNGILKYKDAYKYFNVPLWLFTAYSIFALGALYTYNLVKILFTNKLK